MIDSGAVFLNLMDAIDSRSGVFRIDVKNAGNIHARCIVSMRNRAKCSDNVIHLKGRTKDTTLFVSLKACCNVRALKFYLRDSSDIITSVVRTFTSTRNVYRAELMNSATSVAAERVKIAAGNLIRDIVTLRAPVGALSVIAKTYGCANVQCGSQKSSARIWNGHLIQEVLDLPRTARAKIKTTFILADVGNMYARMKGNSTFVRRICGDLARIREIKVLATDVGEM